MPQSPVSLDSFNPFATHPFTNNSGLAPLPPKPSQYPIPILSSRSQTLSASSSSHHTESSTSQGTSISPVRSPQPRQRWAPVSPPKQPIFVPFRRETSSPDLVLKKKSPSYNASLLAKS